jgi:UDP-N-acetylmuramoylalanine--D-glutamate ligase
LQGHHVLILGLGASGLAMARWCARAGAQVTVADTRAAPPQLATLQRELPLARFVAGALDAALLDVCADQPVQAVYRSPGLSPMAVAAVQSAAQARGLVLGGELSLFAQALADLAQTQGYQPQVLGITGTNGKTTVTSLTGQLVARSGKSVAVAGNIGPTLLDTLSHHLATQTATQTAASTTAPTLPEVWVLELSSFQLDSCDNFEPTAATVLNLTQDHLDWHGNLQAYGAAKAKIFGQRGQMVLDRDDPLVMAMQPIAGPARGRAAARVAEREVVTFGGDEPQRPGDYGIELVNGLAWLVRAQALEAAPRRSKQGAVAVQLQRLMPADALRIRGRHNAVNALAALALAGAAGCGLADMLYGLREYRGEPHRVEPIGMLGDVEYFDDSKGTNVGATVAALHGLGAERKVVVILGGEGKGQDFAPLAQPAASYVRVGVLIGRDAPKIRAALAATGVPLLEASSMEQAVELASQGAQPGDAVLMSPACASFDMFDNYEHRAAVFRNAVAQLAEAAGTPLMGGV